MQLYSFSFFLIMMFISSISLSSWKLLNNRYGKKTIINYVSKSLKYSKTYSKHSISKLNLQRYSTIDSTNDIINTDIIKLESFTTNANTNSTLTTTTTTTTSIRYPSTKYTFYAEDLPDETIYIIDGTAMLFLAHYSKEHNSEFKDVTLSENLTNEILSKMNVDQIAKLLDINNNLDESINNISNTNTMIENKSLISLRCGALITMVINFARIIRDVKPKYVAIAFDAGRKTFRNDLYPSYKMQRKETPPDLLPLFPICIQVLDTLGFKCLMQDGFEADDVMATLSKWSKDRGLNVVHVSPDKDMLQLVDYGVHIMLPKGREMVGVDNVIEKFGIPPQALCDYQAIMGDSVDNIPGVRGIGPKIASVLIQYFNSIENMCEKLGLIGLPVPTDDMLNLSPTNKIISNHLINIMTKEVFDQSIIELNICLKDVSAKPITILARLYLCGYENMVLYKKLVTLKSDISIERLFHGSLSLKTSSIQSNNDMIQHITTEQFRYRGENRNIYSSIEVDKMLSLISPALLKPVKLLREQYHKLDR